MLLKSFTVDLISCRPLKDGERPLFLTLLWGSAHSGHGFRLKDQMDNSPIWDDFKEAELEAFLRMYEGNDFIFIQIKIVFIKYRFVFGFLKCETIKDEEKRAISEIRSNYEVIRYQIETLLNASSSDRRKATPV